MLAHVLDHMLTYAQGPRYMAGDWNFTQDQLAITQQLLDAGWQEVQTLEFLRMGIQPQYTCKGKTQKDFLWLSPELVTAFQGVTIHADTFPDHVVMQANFKMDSQHFVRYLWPTPQETPWSQVPDIAQPVPFQAGNPTEQYAEVWQQRETSAQEVLQHAWSPQMRGRGQRTSTITKKGWPTPPKQGRSRDPQPGFYGYDVQHARWLKQLRRLVNYNNWAQSNWHAASVQSWTHGLLLWRSILDAPGFGHSFASWWIGRGCIGLSDPGFVPLHPPTPDIALQLCECFSSEVRCFERRLMQARKTARVLAHVHNPNLVFRDTQRPVPEPVSTLLVHQSSQVAEVDEDDVAIVLDPPCLFDDTKPVMVGTQATEVIHATETKVYLASVRDAQVGQPVTQTQPVGTLDEVFQAFHEQWRKRWCRHDQVPHSHWENLIAFARDKMPQNSLPSLEINPALLQAEVAFKKPTSATGMDGVSRKDLLAAGPNLLQSLCNMFERAASDGAWPANYSL